MHSLEPEAKPTSLTQRARDALLAYIKGGNALRGSGARLKLAYLIDPFTKQISEVWLRPPYHQHISQLILHSQVTWELHSVPYGPHTTWVCVDQTPHINKVPDTLDAMFQYTQSTKTDPGSRVWRFYGRGVVTATNVANGKTAHCTAPHYWFLDAFAFYNSSLNQFQPARSFNNKVFVATDIEVF
ncbi:MAG: hypothetical protein AB7L09_21505 [Nitrospira sp.]